MTKTAEFLEFNMCNMKFTLVVKIGMQETHADVTHEQAITIKNQVQIANGWDAWKGVQGTCNTYDGGQTKDTHIIRFAL